MDRFALARPLLHALPPETAHRLAILGLRFGLAGQAREQDDPILACAFAGRPLPNPIGLAAGFDKDAEVLAPLLGLGFGFVEAGTVTPEPQPGNPKPRIFRWPKEGGLINRLGFNNGGLDAFVSRLGSHRRGRCSAGGLVGANIGRNKDQTDAIADYVAGTARLAPIADYLVVNVSSPNTPGLRALHGREPLDALLAAVMAARQGTSTPILLKIAPDLVDADLDDVVDVALSRGIDGLIISNTTLERPESMPAKLAQEAGGLSGRPVFALSTRVLAAVTRRARGKLTLIGVGGVASGADAYAKIQAGASLVQLYTALAYRGPGLVGEIKRDLAARLRADGFNSVQEAVGSGL